MIGREILPASADIADLCIKFGNMALPDPSQRRHSFVMRQCDTSRMPDMTPLHDMHMETPLSPLPNRPLGAVHSAPFFLHVRRCESDPRRFAASQGQSRPRAAIDTGSPLPITR